MLLERLKAVNFRGFREILVPTLSETATVSVGGEDPGALPSVLSFALLGLPAAEGIRAIRPGAGYCYVELTLRLAALRICILRGLDRTGRIRVSLRELDRRWVLTRPDEVAARLAELVPLPRAELTRHLLGVGRDTGPRTYSGGNGRAPDASRQERACRARISALRARLGPEEERLRAARNPSRTDVDPEALADVGAALAATIRRSQSEACLSSLRLEARETASRVTRAKRELEQGIARLQAERLALLRAASTAGTEERGEARPDEPPRGMEGAFAAMFRTEVPRAGPGGGGAQCDEDAERRRASIDAEIAQLECRRAETVRLAGRVHGLRTRLGTEEVLAFPGLGEEPSGPVRLSEIGEGVDRMEELLRDVEGAISAGGPTADAAMRKLGSLGFEPNCARGRDPDEIPADELEREIAEEVERGRKRLLERDAVEEVRAVASRRAREIRTQLRIEEECLAGLVRTGSGASEGSGILPDLVAFLSEGRFREIDRGPDGSLFGVKRNGGMSPISPDSDLGVRVELARRMRAADTAIGSSLPDGRLVVLHAGLVPGSLDAEGLRRLLERIAPEARQVFVLGPLEGDRVRLVATGEPDARRLAKVGDCLLGPPSVGLVVHRGGHRAEGLGDGTPDLR